MEGGRRPGIVIFFLERPRHFLFLFSGWKMTLQSHLSRRVTFKHFYKSNSEARVPLDSQGQAFT